MLGYYVVQNKAKVKQLGRQTFFAEQQYSKESVKVMPIYHCVHLHEAKVLKVSASYTKKLAKLALNNGFFTYSPQILVILIPRFSE